MPYSAARRAEATFERGRQPDLAAAGAECASTPHPHTPPETGAAQVEALTRDRKLGAGQRRERTEELEAGAAELVGLDDYARLFRGYGLNDQVKSPVDHQMQVTVPVTASASLADESASGTAALRRSTIAVV